MRIAVDARFVGTPGGLGRYAEELIRAMVEEAPENEYVLFLRDRGTGRFRGVPAVTERRAEVPWYGVREQLLMPGVAAAAKADLVHWTHWNVPVASPRPFVVTIHDLILLDYPTVRATALGPLAWRVKYAGFRRTIRTAVANARFVLVPTSYVAGRVRETFGVGEGKVRVTGEGASALPQATDADVSRLRRALGIPDRYVLAVGNAYPHKNLDGLLDAFASLRQESPPTRLVVAGNDDFFFRRLRREAAARGRDRGVVFAPSPTDADVAALYRGASALAAVSFEEGFGLPPLEAMAAGVPVVAAEAGPFPEVLGDAARFVDPHDPESIAEGIRQVLGDDALRAALVEKGRARAARWTWRETARRTLAAYREALGR